ncbi:hypothetical protein MMC22_010934 [Lobaria immixta]|nr:hypothetical protein [Lobaria immixta]
MVKSWLGSMPGPDRLVPSSPIADAVVDYDCYGKSPSPRPWAKQEQSLDEELGFSAPALESSTPALEPPPREQREKRKGKKTVAFAEELNEVYEVEYWFDPRIHKHREVRFRFCEDVTVVEVFRWIVPDGHNQLHFPRTKWVRDVPDWSVEDQDGDVEMGDC